MPTILVSGGAGFIGSNYVLQRAARHPTDRIIVLDALTYAGNLASLASLERQAGFTFVKGEIQDSHLVDALFAAHRFDSVVHFAAESHVDRSILGPRVFVETNVLGTQVLLDAARKHGLRRFVMVSTDEVYGSLGASGAFTEESPLRPSSPYSASKAGADLLALSYQHTFGLDVTVTRCSNNYGPRQFPEKLIPLMIINALEDRPLPVYGDGMQVRDWIHVADHCEAVDLVLEQGKSGHVYNIGAENEHPNIEIVRRILSLLEKPQTLIRHVTDRPGHDRRYAIDATKIRTELGWRPRHGFEEALDSTVRWYLENRAWWEMIRSGAYRDYYAQQYAAREELDPAKRRPISQ